jgi:hypothetical protein
MKDLVNIWGIIVWMPLLDLEIRHDYGALLMITS